jgi:hypothetical protein
MSASCASSSEQPGADGGHGPDGPLTEAATVDALAADTRHVDGRVADSGLMDADLLDAVPGGPEAGGDGGSSGDADAAAQRGDAGPADGGGGLVDAIPPDGSPPGTTNTWVQLTLPNYLTGDYCQSIVVDPANPGTLITACGNNDGRMIKWYRTTDYGDTWTIANGMAMHGNPWGFSIDPNPSRDPSKAPTLYSPAGYGSLGAWKSTDGAVTWTRLAGADTAFGTYNPFGTASTDLYHTAILPDDPPNHVLATYHYYFKNNTEGGFGETWDGGQTWVVHPPPPGVGTSHYVLPISATTWCVISQVGNGANGIWRTTTAGRTGGTAANKYRDGTISPSAWAKVSDVEHSHGSYTPLRIGTAWYSAGQSPTGGSIWKSTDDGATWTNLAPGYYWPTPPNKAFMNKNVSGLAATGNYIYSNWFYGPEIARAPVSNEKDWRRDYTTTPAGLTGEGGNPLGNAATHDAASGKWMVFMATNVGVWRYIEP